MWLSAILQARERPLTGAHAQVPARFAQGPLGGLGDFGLLLEVMRDFMRERDATPDAAKAQHAEDYAAANAPLHALWLRIVAERVEDLRRICPRMPRDPLAVGAGPGQWSRAHLQEALARGYWRHAVRLVETPQIKSADVFGPYRTIDDAQLARVRLQTGGPWASSPAATMPPWLLCYRLSRFGDPPYLYAADSVVPVDEAVLDAATKHRRAVSQYFAMTWSQWNAGRPRLSGFQYPDVQVRRFALPEGREPKVPCDVHSGGGGGGVAPGLPAAGFRIFEFGFLP